MTDLTLDTTLPRDTAPALRWERPTPVEPGQTLENPVTGERVTFTETAASTNGELLAFDFALRPGGAVPVPHVHPIQTERFEVLEGRMRFRIGLRTRIAGPGDVIEVAPGVAHSFANAGPEEARLRVEVRLARKYDQEAHAPLMSVGAQRLLLAPLVFSSRHPRATLAGAALGTAGHGAVRLTAVELGLRGDGGLHADGRRLELQQDHAAGVRPGGRERELLRRDPVGEQPLALADAAARRWQDVTRITSPRVRAGAGRGRRAAPASRRTAGRTAPRRRSAPGRGARGEHGCSRRG